MKSRDAALSYKAVGEDEIAAYGVMTMPALVVDGQVVSYGKALKKDEVVSILNRVRA